MILATWSIYFVSFFVFLFRHSPKKLCLSSFIVESKSGETLNARVNNDGDGDGGGSGGRGACPIPQTGVSSNWLDARESPYVIKEREIERKRGNGNGNESMRELQQLEKRKTKFQKVRRVEQDSRRGRSVVVSGRQSFGSRASWPPNCIPHAIL